MQYEIYLCTLQGEQAPKPHFTGPKLQPLLSKARLTGKRNFNVRKTVKGESIPVATCRNGVFAYA